MSCCVVFITVPDEKTGKTIAENLVENSLAACVNQVPGITSIYRWQGNIEHDRELLLVCKTQQSCLPELIKRVEVLHPYDVPEIIALPIVGGAQPYLNWVAKETGEA